MSWSCVHFPLPAFDSQLRVIHLMVVNINQFLKEEALNGLFDLALPIHEIGIDIVKIFGVIIVNVLVDHLTIVSVQKVVKTVILFKFSLLIT